MPKTKSTNDGSPDPRRDLFARARKVLESALDQPPREREAFVRGACQNDPALLAEVLSLLAAHRPEDAETTTVSAPTPLTEKAGTVVGRYRLLQQIGDGGFGVVFLAEQREPIHRKVALKVIKLGMDTSQVVARFEAERQALALMDHPHIARVFDGGATDSGRPFFVMEYVQGDPITDFADAHRLTVRERLALIMQCCQAVQHAHHKGIIHRDIKPRNVLVSMVDGRPFAKVIDFGIAKATAARLTERTLFTEHQQLIGTPQYMSPEQAEGSPDIDTRTDVYALGVLLYELLTGVTPFDAKRLRSAAHAEMQRIIREEEPPPPSLRLMKRLATGPLPAVGPVSDRSVADIDPRVVGAEPVGPEPVVGQVSNRSSSPLHPSTPSPLSPSSPSSPLVKSIRGELDWIALKALEKDRTRRYETPSDLAEDLERHLKGEPVIAAPPSLGYRLWKLIRRNRATFITAAAVAATLLIGLATTTWQWRRAQSAILDRDVANDELKRRAADAEWSAYAVNLASAQAAMKHGAFEVARARLAACRPEFRGIEWGLLASEARQTIAEYRTVANYAIGNDNATLLVDVNERNVQAYDFDGRFIAQLLVEGNRSEHPITMSEDRSEFIGVTKDGFLRRWTLDAMPLGMPVKHVAKFDARYQPGGGGAILSCPEPTVAVVSDCTGNVVGVPMEHSGQIADAEFSPDGNTILTTTDNGEARLWDSFGRPRGGPMCHPREINYSVFSSDSKLVLTVCENERARLWSEVGQLLATFDLSGGGRAWICTASDRIITWSQRPQTAQLWNFAGEQVSPKLAHFPFIVSRPAFSTDGTRVALMAERRILQQWDMNGQAVGQRMHHDEDIWDITYSPDGRWLATADKRNHTYLWDEFGRLMCSLTPPQSAAGENSDIELCWDAEQAARLRTVFWGENSSLAMRVVEPPPIKTLTMDHSTFGIEYAAQIGAYLNPCLNRGDDASLNKGRTILIGLGATSADGSRRVLADASGLLRVFATKPDIELAVFPIDPGVPRVAFTPDGLRLILCYDSNRVEIWDGRDPDDRIVDWEAREAERRAARPIVRPWVEDLLAGTRSADELRKLIASTVDRSPLERLAASDELQIRLDALDYASHTAFENLREQHLSPRTLRAAAQSLELVPRVRLLLDERIEKWAKDANALTNAAWKIVKSADAKNPLLAETLEAAEEAARLEPAAANIITTLGVAQYRAGQYEAAATTLAQAAKLISKYSTGVSIPAFRAMAHARLNQLAEARAHLTELRALMKTPEAVNEDSQAWLREAEALIEGSAASASQPSSAPTSAATTAPTTAPSEPRP